MRICLLCASRRGERFLQRLIELQPEADLLVFSFRETDWEPPFLDAIRSRTEAAGGRFVEARRVGRERLRPVWDELEVDLLFAVGWRYMVPPEVYRRARLGAFVFHDSLLPRRRGHSPTVWAMLEGDDRTGVTLLEMDAAADSGDVVGQREVLFGPDATIAEVREMVTEVYLELLESSLPGLLRGDAPRTPQDHSLATWCAKRLPEHNRIDWSQPARAIHDLVRAVTRPYPGAFTQLEGAEWKVWATRRAHGPSGAVDRSPGTILALEPGGARVRTGDGEVWLTEVQPEGRDAGPPASFPDLRAGVRWGS